MRETFDSGVPVTAWRWCHRCGGTADIAVRQIVAGRRRLVGWCADCRFWHLMGCVDDGKGEWLDPPV